MLRGEYKVYTLIHIINKNAPIDSIKNVQQQ